MTQDVNVPDNEQPDMLSEMLAAARASRGTVDGSPYSSGRQDEIDERQYANEWQMAAADAAHDEIQALRVVARTRANDSAYSAWMTAQWFEARRKQRAAEARAVDAERARDAALADVAPAHEALLKAQRQLDEALDPKVKRILVKQWDDLLAERNALQSELDAARGEIADMQADLDRLQDERDGAVISLEQSERELAAAQARIAELSTAVRIAEPAPIERAGPDLATAHAITAHDPTFWFRRCTLLERERAELCAQVARLEAAGGDKPAAAAPAEPPAPDDDEPTLASLGDRKAQQRRAVDVPPLKRDLPKAG